MSQAEADFTVDIVSIDDLRALPENYRSHPEVQLQHLEASLDEFGWYRNIVVASDGVILAGHGIVEAARRKGLTQVPVHRVAFDSKDPRALKLAVADNEVSRLAQDDEQKLEAMLQALGRDGMLEGTGWTNDELAVPDFEPVSFETQGRLDQLQPQWVTCPNCGETFDAKQASEA